MANVFQQHFLRAGLGRMRALLIAKLWRALTIFEMMKTAKQKTLSPNTEALKKRNELARSKNSKKFAGMEMELRIAGRSAAGRGQIASHSRNAQSRCL